MIELLSKAYDYIQHNQSRFWEAVGTHLRISLTALAIAIIICLPLGIWISRHPRAARYIINLVGVARVIPSIAILFLLVPTLGFGEPTALVALVVLAAPPILINTDAGMRGLNPAVIEAGRGMGMSPAQLLARVELPLALPVIIAGIRTAAVEVIASATIAYLIGIGGLGYFIFAGLPLSRYDLLLVGAIPVAILAFTAELVLSAVQRSFRYQ